MIQKSSNVGAAKIALSLPAETMWRMFSEAGFGTPPTTGFPGEVAGRLRPPKTWKPIEQATMSYGHGLSVNLVQLARAYTIFADDGELKPVALFKTDGAVAGRPVDLGRRPRAPCATCSSSRRCPAAPRRRRRSPAIASPARPAPRARSRAASTRDKYVASFVGMAPVSNPRLIVAVMIDEPTGGDYYGGSVAGPVFSSVMGAALRMLGVPTDAPVDNVVLPPPDAKCRRKRERDGRGLAEPRPEGRGGARSLEADARWNARRCAAMRP